VNDPPDNDAFLHYPVKTKCGQLLPPKLKVPSSLSSQSGYGYELNYSSIAPLQSGLQSGSPNVEEGGSEESTLDGIDGGCYGACAGAGINYDKYNKPRRTKGRDRGCLLFKNKK